MTVLYTIHSMEEVQGLSDYYCQYLDSRFIWYLSDVICAHYRRVGLMIGGFVTIMGILGMLPVVVFSMPKSPQIVYTLSHLVPQGWAVEALKIAMDAGAPSDVIINSFVQLGLAALFFVIGSMHFQKRFV